MSYEDIVLTIPTTDGDSLTIAPVTVGDHIVTFELRRIGAPPLQAIEFTASSDAGGSAKGVFAPSPKHDHTEEQFERDIKEFAWNLAELAAGHGRKGTLLDKFFGTH